MNTEFPNTKKSPLLGLFGLCALVVFSCTLQAQRLSYFSYSDKFPELRNGVLHVFQDNEGWIWMTTGSKVIKYDGSTWKTIYPAKGVDIQFCSQIFDLDGKICVRNMPYLLVVDGDSLRKHPLNAEEHDVLAVKKVGNSIFVAGSEGLFEYANNSLTSIIPAHLGNDVMSRLIPFQDSLLVGGLLRNNLFVFNLNQKKVYTANYFLHDLAMAASKKLFVLDGGKLKRIKKISCIDDSLFIDHEVVFNLPIKFAAHISVGKNETVWIAEDKKALYQYQPGSPARTIRLQDGLPGLVMHDIFLDREGNNWLSLGNDLIRIPQKWTQHYTMEDGLPFPSAEHLLFDINSQKLLARTPYGMAVLNDGAWQVLKHNGDTLKAMGSWEILDTVYVQKGDQIFRIDKINEHNAYMTSLFQASHKLSNLSKDSRGFYYWSKQNKVFITKNNQHQQLIVEGLNFIKAIYIDKKDRLWVGEYDGGLKGFKTLHASDSMKVSKLIWTIKPDMNLLKSIRFITEDNNGKLLIGTRFKGFHRLTIQNDTIAGWQHLNGSENPDPVWDIKVDSNNNYWFAGNGACSLNWHKELPERINVGKPFGITQANSIVQAKDGKIWVSTPSGIVSFDPDLTDESYPVQVKITGIWINQNLPFSVSKNVIRLSHAQNNIRVTFSANSFRQESMIQYAYAMVNGNDTIWSEPTTSHTVNFSALASGQYVFMVKAWDFLGRPIPEIATQEFLILAPFYARWWFILMVAFFIIAGTYLLFRYRVNSVRRLMQIRMGIAEDLHDDIGASLTNVLLLNELARSDMKANEQPANLIARSVELIQDISQSLSDIVWNINPRSDGIEQLVARMQRLAGEMLEGANIEGDFHFPKDRIPGTIPMNKRRDFYLVFKELVHNLVRHSEATKAQIVLELKHNRLVLSITDNGRGFDLGSHAKGNGLLNMKQRIENWEGSIKMESTPGKGTSTEVILPI